MFADNCIPKLLPSVDEPVLVVPGLHVSLTRVHRCVMIVPMPTLSGPTVGKLFATARCAEHLVDDTVSCLDVIRPMSAFKQGEAVLVPYNPSVLVELVLVVHNARHV